jgi:chlorophyllide a reductase subunit X
MVVNKDDGTGEAARFAEAAGIPVLASVPAHDDIRRKSASYEIIGRPGTTWAPLFETLAQNVADAPPVRPKPMTQDALLGLFSSSSTGRDYVLEPATLFDMVGKDDLAKPSLEVVYDAA